MKNTLVAIFWLMLCSVAYGDNYNWNNLDIELNDEGAGSSPNLSLSAHIGGNGFARASLLHIEHDDIDVEGRFSFVTAGLKKSPYYVEAGFARLKLCQRPCEADVGPIIMLGATQVGKKINTKIAIGKVNLLKRHSTIFEAHITYKLNDELGLHLSFTDLNYIGEKTTNLGLRFSW